MPGFDYDDGFLRVDGVDVRTLAGALGTPVFVYSAGLIRERLGLLRDAFSSLRPAIRYAMKANSNAALLRLLAAEGAGFDIVSGGELMRVQRIGAAPESCVFAGVGKQDWEIRDALRAGVGAINIESEGELDLVAAVARREGCSARVALRVNPDVKVDTHAYISTGRKENKFGVDLGTADRMVATIHDAARLSLIAYHVHLGSLVLEADPFVEACRRVMEFIDGDRARRDGVELYDVGGGFGSHGPFSETKIDLTGLGSGLADLLRPRGLGLVLEPGRFIVGDAGVLVTRLIQDKHGVAKDFYVVDAAMNDLIRPALYQAEHDIRPVVIGGAARSRPVDVVGPICESADFLGLARDLPVLDTGALIAVFAAGAYCMSMASNYNSRPIAAEVLAGDGPPRVIRRREAFEDLWANEVDAEIDLGATRTEGETT